MVRNLRMFHHLENSKAYISDLSIFRENDDNCMIIIDITACGISISRQVHETYSTPRRAENMQLNT